MANFEFMPPRDLLSRETLAMEVDGAPIGQRDGYEWHALASRPLPPHIVAAVERDMDRPLSLRFQSAMGIDLPFHFFKITTTDKRGRTSFFDERSMPVSAYFRNSQEVLVEVMGRVVMQTGRFVCGQYPGDGARARLFLGDWMSHEQYITDGAVYKEITLVGGHLHQEVLGGYDLLRDQFRKVIRVCMGEAVLMDLCGHHFREQVALDLMKGYGHEVLELMRRHAWLRETMDRAKTLGASLLAGAPSTSAN